MRKIMTLAAVLTAFILPSIAHADVYGVPSGWTTGNPVVRIPTNVFLGVRSDTGKHVILARRTDTNVCDGPWDMGAASGFNSTMDIWISNAAWPNVGAPVGDSFGMETSAQYVYCSSGVMTGDIHYGSTTWTILPVVRTNSKEVRVHGGSGADYIRVVGGLGWSTHVWAGGGDDYLDTTNAQGALAIEGEAGNDTIKNLSPYSDGSYFGGDGNDCLLVGPAQLVNCGPGTDKVNMGAAGNVLGCETYSANSCP
jgi:hypothetical protein